MKEVVNDEISKSIDKNIKYIKELLEGSSDMVFREFLIGNKKAFMVYIDGMADKILLNDYVLESLMLEADKVSSIDNIKNKILTVTDVSEQEN